VSRHTPEFGERAAVPTPGAARCMRDES